MGITGELDDVFVQSAIDGSVAENVREFERVCALWDFTVVMTDHGSADGLWYYVSGLSVFTVTERLLLQLIAEGFWGVDEQAEAIAFRWVSLVRHDCRLVIDGFTPAVGVVDKLLMVFTEHALDW